MNSIPKVSENPENQLIVADIYTMLDKISTKSIRNTPKYKLFLAVLKHEALYEEVEEVAATICNLVGDPSPEITDAELDFAAKSIVDVNNLVYATVLEDLKDKGKAQRVFRIMIESDADQSYE